MKLPAFFGHKRSINLLPRDAFENSTLGVVLEWALVFGKWAVIVTQLVVMGAFLYRFTLDRKLTDLRKDIDKNVAVIKSYEQMEKDYTLAQKQVAQAKIILDGQAQMLKTVSEIEKITPSQIWYDRITVSPESMALTAYAATLPGFGQFLTAVQRNPLFSTVNVGKIERRGSNGEQLQFDVSLSLVNELIKSGEKNAVAN